MLLEVEQRIVNMTVTVLKKKKKKGTVVYELDPSLD